MEHLRASKLTDLGGFSEVGTEELKTSQRASGAMGSVSCGFLRGLYSERSGE